MTDAAAEEWVVHVNNRALNAAAGFKGNTWVVTRCVLTNRICTTKYNWITFLPKNLFEQFHRLANVYFLFIVVLNWVPQISAFGREVAMLPLVFVLSVTCIKDLYEDR